MCGRYAASAGAQEVIEALDVDDDRTGGALRPTWNAAPTQRHPVVLTRAPPDEQPREDERPHEGAPALRELRLLTWGLVPSWSRDGTGGARMINARSETLLERPAFRRAAVARRCLVPAQGWYEWRAAATGAPGGAAASRGRKQPHLMTLADGGTMALAGIYELWRRRPAAGPGAGPVARSLEDGVTGAGDDEPGAEPDPWLVTFAVLTREAEPGLRAVHDRMPLVLPRQVWASWLDPTATGADQVAELVHDATHEPPGRFTAVPVGPRVGQVREDDAGLVEPVGPPLDLGADGR